MRQTGSWRPGDAQLGWIIENRIDEAYTLSWPGPLETWVPLHDTGGYDRARAPLGSYDFRLDQIKGTATLQSGNQVRLSFNTPALHPLQILDFTVVHYDLPTRNPTDPAWLFPSTKLSEVCTLSSGHREPLWVFVGNRSGLARDRAAPYQIAISELAAARGWSVLPPKYPSPLAGEPFLSGSRDFPRGQGRGHVSVDGVSQQPVEVNTFFKRHFDAVFLEAATGDEVLMAAVPDVFGRHRLAFSKATGRWASIAIHGGTVTSSTQLIQANIHLANFSPHPRHYVLVQHFDGRLSDWYPWSWFMPSIDFARLATGKGPYLLFTTTLNPQRVNRWTPYRMPTSRVPTAFREALHRSPARRAA